MNIMLLLVMLLYCILYILYSNSIIILSCNKQLQGSLKLAKHIYIYIYILSKVLQLFTFEF